MSKLGALKATGREYMGCRLCAIAWHCPHVVEISSSKESGNGEAEGQLPKSVHRSLQRHDAVACAHSAVRNSGASAVLPGWWYSCERQERTALGSSGVVVPAVMVVKRSLSTTQVRLVLLVRAAECTASTIVGHAHSACRMAFVKHVLPTFLRPAGTTVL